MFTPITVPSRSADTYWLDARRSAVAPIGAFHSITCLVFFQTEAFVLDDSAEVVEEILSATIRPLWCARVSIVHDQVVLET